MIGEQIKKELEKLIETSGLSFSGKVNVEHPSDFRHGDYSTNVAMVAFGKSKITRSTSSGQKSKVQGKMQKWSNPLELAQDIKDRLAVSDQLLSVVDRVEVAPPGFINFWLSKEYLISRLANIVEKEELVLKGEALRSKKIMVEFTDPNPFKEFHVGHLYSNTVGEAICRLLESQGAVVKRVNYQGDVGLHVAKAMWGMRRKFKVQPFGFAQGESSKFKVIEDVERTPLPERVRFLGEAYAMGSKAYEEDEQAKEEMIVLNKKIYEKDPEIMPLYEKGRAWSLEYFESIYKRLGTKFDYYYFESKSGAVGLKLVLEQLKRGIFVKSDGAVIFPGEKYGLHNRVFINSLGLPTYEAKDLGLAPTKYQDFPYDQSIIVTGNEINAYFRVLIEALKRVNPDLGEKTTHLSHGMLRLPTGKMSSRTGQVITGEWLLDEAKRRMQERFPQMREGTADMVAVGAVKYALLRSTIGKDVIFDIDESISLEGNSGPYLQYTFARTQSVLRKAEAEDVILRSGATKDPEILRYAQNDITGEEIAVLRTLYRFPEMVEQAAAEFSPNLVCSYLFDLAQKFNLFYQRHPILTPEVPIENYLGGGIDTTPREFRLALTAAVGEVLKNGLHLLGIEAPERM